MTLRKFFIGRATGFIVVLIVVLLVAGFHAFNNYIYEQKQGETDPSQMTLTTKTWTWVYALYNDDRSLKPREGKENSFTLTFGTDSKFTATTECNSMGGSYVADRRKRTISISNMFSTEMFCEGSQESDFAALLQNAAVYSFTSQGELVLDQKFDSGSAVFK